MQNSFLLENMIEKISRGESTYFLTRQETQKIESILRKNKIEYFSYLPFEEAEKTIIYKDCPRIKLYKIKSKEPLKHNQILGALYNLQIDNHLFGDIVIMEETYIYLVDTMATYIVNSLYFALKNKIECQEVELNTLHSYQREYEEISFPIASTRIDIIFSKITHKNRNKIDSYLHQKAIVINDNFVLKSSHSLKIGDIFSIRKHGKYKVENIKETKNGKRLFLKKYQ